MVYHSMVYQSMVFQWYLVLLWPTVYHSFNSIPLNGIINGTPVNGLSMVFGSIVANGIPLNDIPLNGILNGIPVNGLSMIFGSIMANGIPLNGITLNGILNGISINGLSTVFGSNMANGIAFIQWYTIEWYSEWYTGQRSFNGIW